MTHVELLHALWGRRIRAARLDRELTVLGLARLADVDPGNLSRLERGLQGASDEMRMSVAAALGKRVDELFPYPDTTHANPRAAGASSGASAQDEDL